MKLRIGCLTFVLLSLVLSAAAQVAGTGTTGYVPIWTDSTTLGDSTIFEKNSAVGIGTSAPTATLNVVSPNFVLFKNNGFKPVVLQVTGGQGAPGVGKNGGPGGTGSGISVTSGAGGTGSEGIYFGAGGPGGPIQITSGTGGQAGCYSDLPTQFCRVGGIGGSIQITAGTGGASPSGGRGGNGGSITVQPGAGGPAWSTFSEGVNGNPGNLLPQRRHGRRWDGKSRQHARSCRRRHHAG